MMRVILRGYSFNSTIFSNFLINSVLFSVVVDFIIYSMDTSLFVLRRAWRMGQCRRADVDEAFGTENSPNRASKIIKQAVARWSSHLLYLPHRGVFPNTRAACPEPARAEVVLDLLARRAPPQETGLLPGDGVPFLHPSPKPSRAATDAATQAVLDAALRNAPLDILYVGLRRYESARWRHVWPRAMECTGLHWRLHAQDLDDAARGYPIKTFVLARVLGARTTSDWVRPADFRPKEVLHDRSRLRVHLSPSLTPDQVTAIENQFDIHEGKMTWPRSALHSFRREFTESQVPPDVVWPVIERIDEIG